MTNVPSFLRCAECKSLNLEWCEDLVPCAPPFDVTEGLKCCACARVYPYVDGVWVMWSDQVRRLQLGTQPTEDLSDQVKWANIQIYDTVGDEYGEHQDGSRPYSETLLFLKALATDFQLPSNVEGRRRVLVDIGCSTGNSLGLFSSLYDDVVGFDLSIANLRSVAKKGYSAVLGDVDRIPFADQSIDLVTCFATLHHLPAPSNFITNARGTLRPGGVLLVGCEPSRAALRLGPLAKLVWDLRKPIYRKLGRLTSRNVMHRSKELQDANDIAEIGRTHGGFDPLNLSEWLQSAGFEEVRVFHGLDLNGLRSIGVPGWKQGLLKILSGQNPLLRSNWVNLTAMGRR